ncbi:MAG: hypothetical protein A2365_01610 [Candidatus Nealsonbacteria bacterium RIFOXYB1_FULL_40_15]|uniref:Response regulatory domain-containing protein n=1 Tax=Candidatus Nealsonbacteria bacterium RIFOXYB1_FULL_40_15 TaxID=1801677 RepID=A0A1G2ENB8_9BACT|nr:MAG: hypothetical protein A2365_01610 [Candidatus Nealsonbacteria bacterium RIFOXYB1_FULL_40_15]OGZ29948.1 MAG: hypothetical protein A2562_02775 [Candidatus Nealsonbacteria bacterium RIFOXYD1_FULL_39_11]
MKKKRIFLIEDDLPTIEVYKMGMEQAGFDVSVATTGQEALEKIGEMNPENRPDLILLDIILPDMNGIDILKDIRKHENTKDIRVFILTNYTSDELEKKGLLLKSQRYLLKTDYKPRELASFIEEELAE